MQIVIKKAVVVIDAAECELKRLKKGHQNTTKYRNAPEKFLIFFNIRLI